MNAEKFCASKQIHVPFISSTPFPSGCPVANPVPASVVDVVPGIPIPSLPQPVIHSVSAPTATPTVPSVPAPNVPACSAPAPSTTVSGAPASNTTSATSPAPATQPVVTATPVIPPATVVANSNTKQGLSLPSWWW